MSVTPLTLTSNSPSAPVTASGNIELQFSAAILAGVGKITITDGVTQSYLGRDGTPQTRIVGDSDTRVIDISSAQVTINGDKLIINPTDDLHLGLEYQVVIDSGAITNTEHAAFSGLTHTGLFQFAPVVSVPALSIGFGYDTGSSDTDLVTNQSWQDIYVDISGDTLATDHVEVFVNGAWHTATREDGEGLPYYYLSAETVGDLSGSGDITARLVSNTNVVKSVQTSHYTIDDDAPTWSAVDATLSLNSGTDTGEVGDNTTQFLNVTVDVDLHGMSGLEVGDRISISEAYEGEGVWIGPIVGTEHVITDADLRGDGHLSFNLSFENHEGEEEEEEGPWDSGHHSLKVVVSDLAGNRAEEGSYSNQTLELHIDREPAEFLYGETSGDLTQLIIHFDEGVAPEGFKLVKVSDSSEILLTPGMFTFSEGYSVVTIHLPAALQNDTEYRLESTGSLYDRAAGNITGTNPLDTFTARYGEDATLHDLSISNDTGSADGITNVAAQTVSGSYTGTLYGPQKIQVSVNGGDSWQDVSLSGKNWSLSGVTLAAGENHVLARVSNGGDNFGGIDDTFTLDTTAPGLGSAPDLLAAFDDGASNSDNTTSLTSLTVTALLGTESGYRVGDVVDILDDGSLVGHYTITASDLDFYGDMKNVDITLNTLAEGSHSLSVRVTDGAGNVVTGPSLTVTIDIPDPDNTPPTAVLNVDSVTYSSSTGVVGIELIGDYADAIVEYSLNLVEWLPASGTGQHREFVQGTSPYLDPWPGVALRVVDAAGNIGGGATGLPHGSIIFIDGEANTSVGAFGYDAVYVHGGNDTINFARAADFAYVDGGADTDTLSLFNAATFASSTATLAGKLNSVEVLHLAAMTGTASITSYTAITGLGVTTLRIDGGASATVDIGAGHWTLVSQSTTPGTYDLYTSNNINLEILEAVVIVGTPVLS
jgi:hypothetical protein